MKNKFFFSAVLVCLLVFGLTISSCTPPAAIQAELDAQKDAILAKRDAVLSAPSVDAVEGFSEKFLWLHEYAVNDSTYVVEVDKNEFIGDILFPYKDRDITIILKGIGANRTISSRKNSPIYVHSGVTLVLDDNITIKGNGYNPVLQVGIFGVPEEYKTLVIVSDGGTLVMNDGSTITGGFNNRSDGGGVYVSNGGTFIMKGGTISGNTCSPIIKAADAASAKAFIQAKTGSNLSLHSKNFTCKGGGVYVSSIEKSLFGGKISPSGTFDKTGGTITGYADDKENGNMARDHSGNAIQNYGHAIYFAGSEGEKAKSIDVTVGPEMNLSFSDGIFSESRNEGPKPKEITAEPAPAETQTQDAPLNSAFDTPLKNAFTQDESENAKPEKIAVYVSGASDVGIKESFGNKLLAAITQSGKYAEIENSETFYEELAKKYGQIAQTAKQYGADVVCVVNITEALGAYSISARLIKTADSQVLKTASLDRSLKSLNDLTIVSNELAAQLLGLQPPPAAAPVAAPVAAPPSAQAKTAQPPVDNGVSDGVLKDSRDGNRYDVIEISKQVWMAENLNYKVSGSRCYGNKPENCKKYGRLYNWAAAMKACPYGWHLPSNSEWEELYKAVGGKEEAGKKLKARSGGWNYKEEVTRVAAGVNGRTKATIYTNRTEKKFGNGTDEIGFSALPGGYGSSGENFDYVGKSGCWWSSGEYNNSHAYYCSIDYDSDSANCDEYDKSDLFSVRCLQD